MLDSQTVQFIQRYVSMNLATTDANNRPAVTRVFGCRVNETADQLTIFLSSANNQILLDNIRNTRNIAVVFSRPTTHQTLQLKGNDAELLPVAETDLAIINSYRESMVEELSSIGYPTAFTHSLIPPITQIDTAMRFTPITAFTQTPGPQAGKKISV